MLHCNHCRFTNGILYLLLLLLMLTCPIKREIKHALTIPITEATHTNKDNSPTCIALVAKGSIATKQKDRDIEKKRLALFLPLSAASFTAITATQQKAYCDRFLKEGRKLFIYYLKLVI